MTIRLHLIFLHCRSRSLYLPGLFSLIRQGLILADVSDVESFVFLKIVIGDVVKFRLITGFWSCANYRYEIFSLLSKGTVFKIIGGVITYFPFALLLR